MLSIILFIVLVIALVALFYMWTEVKRLDYENHTLAISVREKEHKVLYYRKENDRLKVNTEQSLMAGLVSVPEVQTTPNKQVQLCSKKGVVTEKKIEVPKINNTDGLGDSDNNGNLNLFNNDSSVSNDSFSSNSRYNSYSDSSSDYSGGGGDTGGGGSGGSWDN